MDWYTKGFRAHGELGQSLTTIPDTQPEQTEYVRGWRDAMEGKPRHRPKFGSGGFVDRLVEDCTDRELVVFRRRFILDPKVLEIVDEEIAWRQMAPGGSDRCK